VNIKELKDWLATLPSEVDEYDFKTLIRSGSFPLTLKRIVVDANCKEVIANPMGTHFSDEDYKEMNITHRLQT
jgi:hypothetical protein